TVVAHAYDENPAFGLLVEVAATTGARLSQIGRLTIADLIIEGGEARLMMPTSKKGRGRKVVRRYPLPIPMALGRKLRGAAGNREADALLLLQQDGNPWQSSADTRYWGLFRSPIERAGLNPNVVTFNSLRHTSITRQLIANLPVRIVAATHDTS